MAQAGQKSLALAVHPKYSVMVSAAISSLNDRSGSSRPAILNYIKANYQVTHPQAGHHLNMSLKAGLKKGSLKMARPAGKGANSFKLVKNVETTKTVVKPAQKTTSTKKRATNVAKKPVKGSDKKSKATKEKNNGKKATKKAGKKDVAKKPSKTATLKQPAKKATSVKSKTTEKKAIKKTTLKKPVKKSMKTNK